MFEWHNVALVITAPVYISAIAWLVCKIYFRAKLAYHHSIMGMIETPNNNRSNKRLN